MAKSCAIFFNLALMISLLLIFTAEGRLIAHEVAKATTLTCVNVHGVEKGETCFSIQKEFSLGAEDFAFINPNLVCDKLFAGQWVCLAGGGTA